MWFYFLRHWKVWNNLDWFLNGWEENQELSNQWLKDFEDANFQEKLKKLNIDKIFSSKLIRAIQTSQKVAEIIWYNKNIIKDNRLNEQMYWEFSWKKVDDLLEKYNCNKTQLSYIYRTKNENWETWEEYVSRIRSFLIDNTKEINNKNVLVVAHWWVYKALISIIHWKSLKQILDEKEWLDNLWLAYIPIS